MSGADILVQQATSSISTWTSSYYLWIIVFYVLCLAVIVMPAVVALDILSVKTNRILAGATAAVGAIMAWANLGVIAANFDTARADLQLALIQYDLDKDKAKLLAVYQKAQERIRQAPPGTPTSPSPPR